VGPRVPAQPRRPSSPPRADAQSQPSACSPAPCPSPSRAPAAQQACVARTQRVERPPPPLLVGPACQDTVFLPQNGSAQFSRPRRLQNRTVRDFCAVSRPPTPPLVTTSPWTAAGATLRPERRRRRRARSPHSLRSAEVSSSSLSSLYRSPPRRSYQSLAVLLRDAVCGARRTMVTCSRALLQVVTQRRQRAARACCYRRLPVPQARCPTCKPRAPSSCPCAQRPSSCALGALRPVPIPRSPSPVRARRTPSTPPCLAMATESPSPTPPVSLQPAPSVRPPSPCLGLTNSRVAHVKSHVRSASQCSRSRHRTTSARARVRLRAVRRRNLVYP
jgi:hypothetical protein